MTYMENEIQAKIRLALGQGTTRVFRNNVGVGWVGRVKSLPNGDKLIQEPRPLHAGLCEGSSDLIGWTTVTVRPDMVGKRHAVFTAIEVKQPGRSPSPTQRQFIATVRQSGGYAGVATDEHSARLICKGI